jgi:hypothetical protein
MDNLSKSKAGVSVSVEVTNKTNWKQSVLRLAGAAFSLYVTALTVLPANILDDIKLPW